MREKRRNRGAGVMWLEAALAEKNVASRKCPSRFKDGVSVMQ